MCRRGPTILSIFADQKRRTREVSFDIDPELDKKLNPPPTQSELFDRDNQLCGFAPQGPIGKQ